MKTRYQSIQAVLTCINQTQMAFRSPTIGPLNDPVAALKRTILAVEEVGFIGTADLLQVANEMARCVTDYVQITQSFGDFDTAAELFGAVSELYFSAGRATRFRRPAEEVRALSSPGNFYALRATQFREKARLRTMVGVSFVSKAKPRLARAVSSYLSNEILKKLLLEYINEPAHPSVVNYQSLPMSNLSPSFIHAHYGKKEFDSGIETLTTFPLEDVKPLFALPNAFGVTHEKKMEITFAKSLPIKGLLSEYYFSTTLPIQKSSLEDQKS